MRLAEIEKLTDEYVLNAARAFRESMIKDGEACGVSREDMEKIICDAVSRIHISGGPR